MQLFNNIVADYNFNALIGLSRSLINYKLQNIMLN